MLFEIYQRFGSVNASGERLLRALAPPLLGGLVVLLLFQVPLAWSMARRLQRGHARARGAARAAPSRPPTQERRRIAADLHDGVVQDLAGVAFGLAPLAADAARRGDDDEAEALREATGDACARACATCARCSSRSTRRTSSRPGWRRRSATCSARSRRAASRRRSRSTTAAARRATTRSSTASRARRCATRARTPRPTVGAASRSRATDGAMRRRRRPTTAAASTPRERERARRARATSG